LDKNLIMKKQITNTLLLFMVIQIPLLAQKKNIIKLIDYSKEIKITDVETTHLIFENDIEYIDVGNKYFATDVLKNIVKIKFINTKDEQLQPTTNLTVITKKGAYYSFKLIYDQNNFGRSFNILSSNFNIDQFNSIKPETDFEKKCFEILKKPKNINKKSTGQKMSFIVNGMYYIDDLIYIRLLVENNSRLDFTLGQADFWIRTKNTNKRKLAAFQTRIVKPYYIYNYSNEILGHNKKEMVFVFKRFVPLKNEIFVVQITESDGGGRRGSIKLNIEDFLIK